MHFHFLHWRDIALSELPKEVTDGQVNMWLYHYRICSVCGEIQSQFSGHQIDEDFITHGWVTIRKGSFWFNRNKEIKKAKQ